MLVSSTGGNSGFGVVVVMSTHVVPPVLVTFCVVLSHGAVVTVDGDVVNVFDTAPVLVEFHHGYPADVELL